MIARFKPVPAAFLALLLMAIFAVAARAEVKIQDVRSSKGVSAWLVEDYTVPVIAIRFSFEGGTTQDPAGKEGLANLMTAMFDEGAGPFESEAYQIRLDDAGAEMSYSVDGDRFEGGMRMLADQRDEALELLRLAVNEPRFDQDPLDRMRAQIVAGIVASERDPSTEAGRKWAEALYPGHPYARRAQGTPESLATITRDDLKAFHRKIFARKGLKIGVVGAIDAETLKKALDSAFGDLPEATELTPVPDVTLKAGQSVSVFYDLPQTSLQLAFPGIERHDPDYFAAYLMNYILGGGSFQSRLFDQVREKRGLAYSIGSGLSSSEHTNSLSISTSTRSDRAPETLALVRAILAEMAEKGVTEEELVAAKKYVIGAYAINNLDSSSSIARTLVGLQVDDLGIDYMQKREGLINAVTRDGVNAAAKRLLAPEPSIMTVGPKPEAKTTE